MSGFVRSSAVSCGMCFDGAGWCLDCAVDPHVCCGLGGKGEAEAGVGQDKGAAWVRLPHLGGGLREEGTGSVGGTTGCGGLLIAVWSSVRALGTYYQRSLKNSFNK